MMVRQLTTWILTALFLNIVDSAQGQCSGCPAGQTGDVRVERVLFGEAEVKC